MPVNGRLIKSKEIRDYDKQITIWILKQNSKIYTLRQLAKEWVDTGYCLKVELVFEWPKDKMLTKNGTPKANDVDGRIKSTLDAIAIIIGQDDKYVIEINVRKEYSNKNYGECNAIIKPIFWKDSNGRQTENTLACGRRSNDMRSE